MSSASEKYVFPYFFLNGWGGIDMDGWVGVEVEVDGALDGEESRLVGWRSKYPLMTEEHFAT